ncbi:hypothetical protein BDW22DRAFT_1361054 [Trametopsis cervina]|nr:hypothetical protein BDW22DRAFT_1361054 [Trametopsis cervina]
MQCDALRASCQLSKQAWRARQQVTRHPSLPNHRTSRRTLFSACRGHTHSAQRTRSLARRLPCQLPWAWVWVQSKEVLILRASEP